MLLDRRKLTWNLDSLLEVSVHFTPMLLLLTVPAISPIGALGTVKVVLVETVMELDQLEHPALLHARTINT